jgi:hypothetical protein
MNIGMLNRALYQEKNAFAQTAAMSNVKGGASGNLVSCQ